MNSIPLVAASAVIVEESNPPLSMIPAFGTLWSRARTEFRRTSMNLSIDSRSDRPVGISVSSGDQYFYWTLDVDDWNYFFINGKMRLSTSATNALIGPPLRLAGPCKWEINARIRDGKPMIPAGLKDENGCTLRIVRKGGKTISPKLTLIQDGQVKAEETMQFG